MREWWVNWVELLEEAYTIYLYVFLLILKNDDSYSFIMAWSTCFRIWKTILGKSYKFCERWVLKHSMFSSRKRYFQSVWYNAIRRCKSGYTWTRPISHSLSGYGTLILCSKWFEGTTKSAKYLQRTRVRYLSYSHKNRSHWLGRTGNTSPQCCIDSSWRNTSLTLRKMMGEFHRYSHPNSFRKEGRHCLHSLGQFCNLKKITYR